MAIDWTIEKLSALEPVKLEVVRQNALRAKNQSVIELCEELQASRKRKKSTAPSTSPVIGFHYVCPTEYEVTELPDGRFSSGIWVADEAHCDPAVKLGGYVALHSSKAELSYRQGTIVGWNRELRTKGKRQWGVTFELQPFDEALPWFGDGSGERGYRRADDLPHWTPVRNRP